MQNENAVANRVDKIFIVGLIIWILAQLIRFIAIPLIISVKNGVDAPGWMYPAVLDVVTAVFAIPVAILVWKSRGFTTWSLTVIYFTLSITDHIGALTNLALIGEPLAFEQFNGGGNPYTAPIVQTVLDIIFMGLLLMPRFRGLFFQLSKPERQS